MERDPISWRLEVLNGLNEQWVEIHSFDEEVAVRSKRRAVVGPFYAAHLHALGASFYGPFTFSDCEAGKYSTTFEATSGNQTCLPCASLSSSLPGSDARQTASAMLAQLARMDWSAANASLENTRCPLAAPVARTVLQGTTLA